VGGGVGGRECGWQGVGRGLVWKGLKLLPAAPRAPGRKERKRKKNGKTQKIVPRGPGRPRGESSIIGIPKSKTITLGDPGYPEGIPRVEGIPT